MRIKECNIEEIMLEEYRNFSERSFRNTKGKNEFEEDKKSTALVEIRAEILQQLQVSATEFEKQIQIFQLELEEKRSQETKQTVAVNEWDLQVEKIHQKPFDSFVHNLKKNLELHQK
jgi:hypothetical protein